MNRKLTNKFKLFSNCIPVKGYRRSLICDVQRGEIKLIPNGLYDILIEYNGKTYEEVVEDYGESNRPAIDQYFQFLEKNELVFWTQHPENFPEINNNWNYPGIITNAIIDCNEYSCHNYSDIFHQLADLGCRAIQLRFYSNISLEQLTEIIEILENSRIQHIDIFVKFDTSYTEEAVKAFCFKYVRIQLMCIHSAPGPVQTELEIYNTAIFYITNVVNDQTHCGVVSSEYFAVNMPMLLEAKTYNSCLNRKISIDVNGDIKNCPSLSQKYGNISNNSLHSALLQKEFKDLWIVNKDQIEICKDCEFRYVCTDCRAFIQDENNKYSKPAKCTYDPYTATWEEDRLGGTK